MHTTLQPKCNQAMHTLHELPRPKGLKLNMHLPRSQYRTKQNNTYIQSYTAKAYFASVLYYQLRTHTLKTC